MCARRHGHRARADDSGDLPIARAGHDEPNGVSVGSIDPRNALDIRALYGPPDAFAVLYFDEQGAAGTVATVSMSRWSYYDEGVEFSFAGDEVVAETWCSWSPGRAPSRCPTTPTSSAPT